MANLEKLVEELSTLTVLEAAQLSKLLEEKWGVSAAAPVAVAAAPGAAAGAPAAEAKDEFTVVLTAAGDKKINVIKAVREITGLGPASAEAGPPPSFGRGPFSKRTSLPIWAGPFRQVALCNGWDKRLWRAVSSETAAGVFSALEPIEDAGWPRPSIRANGSVVSSVTSSRWRRCRT